jgi:hypothetical protein
MLPVVYRLHILLLTLLTGGLLLALIPRPPLPVLTSGLDLCPGPCWAGVEPGRTRLDEVSERVTVHLGENVLLQRLNRFTAYSVDAPAHNILGEIGARDGRVSFIRLNVLQPLWRMLMLLGPPRCVQYVDQQRLPNAVNIYWQFENVSVMANLNTSLWNPEQLTHTLQIWETASGGPCLTEANSRPWRGFTSLR